LWLRSFEQDDVRFFANDIYLRDFIALQTQRRMCAIGDQRDFSIILYDIGRRVLLWLPSIDSNPSTLRREDLDGYIGVFAAHAFPVRREKANRLGGCK
jgi:hypothetical protein